LAQEAQPLAYGDAALEQEGPDLIDDGGALADQTRTHPMQRLQVELVDTLGGDKAHGGTLHSLGHSLSVAEVVLLALEEGLHELPRHQLHVVAKREELTAQMKTGVGSVLARPMNPRLALLVTQ
jgi:hypothetical protein